MTDHKTGTREDLTVYGRQEEDSPPGWSQQPT